MKSFFEANPLTWDGLFFKANYLTWDILLQEKLPALPQWYPCPLILWQIQLIVILSSALTLSSLQSF